MRLDAPNRSVGETPRRDTWERTIWFRASGLDSDSDSAAWLRYIEPWSQVGDPLADAVFPELRTNGHGLRDPAAQLKALCERSDAPDSARALRAELESLPDWVDFELMRRGAAMARRNFPALIAALTYGALPLVFSHPSSAAVFLQTGNFAASIPRRLDESATLFFGVTDTAGLRPGGRVWETCLQVRLIHAAIRRQLLASPNWQHEQHGLPISALQTAAGPAYFGTSVLRSMRALGAVIAPHEAAGHCMTWRYVSYLLGVPKQLLGETQLDQDVFDREVMRHVFQPDDTGRQMLGILLDGLAKAPRTRRLTRPQQAALMRVVLGDVWADQFGLPRSDPEVLRKLQAVLGAYARIASLPLAARATEALGRRVLGRLAQFGVMRTESGR